MRPDPVPSLFGFSALSVTSGKQGSWPSMRRLPLMKSGRSFKAFLSWMMGCRWCVLSIQVVPRRCNQVSGLSHRRPTPARPRVADGKALREIGIFIIMLSFTGNRFLKSLGPSDASGRTAWADSHRAVRQPWAVPSVRANAASTARCSTAPRISRKSSERSSSTTRRHP